MVRSVPRARAGLSRLAASPVPAWPPAPTRVWTSSMKSTMGVVLDCTASSRPRRRFSNSPFMLAPACSRPTSSTRSSTPCSGGGTSPWAMRRARPSTTAVLPTPASPTRMGLFWRRRSRMSTIWRTSSSRPVTGSSSPALARAVRSTVYCCSAPPWPGATPVAWLASPGVPSSPLPSAARMRASGESGSRRAKASLSAGSEILSNSREMERSSLASERVRTMPDSR
ncbi:hypothetical protein KDK82_1907 [Delftia sp. K82]|nr:hypothetical protein KDK82_1907 [Delftia sp. K82]